MSDQQQAEKTIEKWVETIVDTPLKQEWLNNRLAPASIRNEYAMKLAACHNNIEVVRLLLSLNNPTKYDVQALVYVCQRGHFEIAKLLLPVSKVSRIIFSTAARQGCLKIVEMLLTSPRGHEFYQEMLLQSAYSDHVDIVKRLVPFCDAKMIGEAFSGAAEMNRVQVCKYLIPFVSQKMCDDALFKAIPNGCPEIVNLLAPVSNCSTVFKKCVSHHIDASCLHSHIQKEKIFNQQKRLDKKIEKLAAIKSIGLKRKI